MKKEDIKVGDILYVPSPPERYSSTFGKNPIHEDIYPITFTVENLRKHDWGIALKGGGYGWSAQSLIDVPGFKVLTDKTYELWQ